MSKKQDELRSRLCAAIACCKALGVDPASVSRYSDLLDVAEDYKENSDEGETLTDYVEGWLEGYVDDARDRMAYEAGQTQDLFTALGKRL